VEVRSKISFENGGNPPFTTLNEWKILLILISLREYVKLPSSSHSVYKNDGVWQQNILFKVFE
jgi:hypothetical protein